MLGVNGIEIVIDVTNKSVYAKEDLQCVVCEHGLLARRTTIGIDNFQERLKHSTIEIAPNKHLGACSQCIEILKLNPLIYEERYKSL